MNIGPYIYLGNSSLETICQECLDFENSSAGHIQAREILKSHLLDYAWRKKNMVPDLVVVPTVRINDKTLILGSNVSCNDIAIYKMLRHFLDSCNIMSWPNEGLDLCVSSEKIRVKAIVFLFDALMDSIPIEDILKKCLDRDRISSICTFGLLRPVSLLEMADLCDIYNKTKLAGADIDSEREDMCWFYKDKKQVYPSIIKHALSFIKTKDFVSMSSLLHEAMQMLEDGKSNKLIPVEFNTLSAR